MIDLDEDRPKAPAKPNLEQMGIAELEEYIKQREAEITLAREYITKKKSAKAAADAFFKPEKK